MSCSTTLAALVALVSTLSGIYGVRIKQLDLPSVVRNGTGPFTLSCVYELEGDETGLVVKWFHSKNELVPEENELIYQWIPPMAPQDTGVISGRAEYTDKILRHPRSHSIIQLRRVTIEMGGKYTCTVSTFQEEDAKTGTMTVYVPESFMEIRTMVYNESHMSLICDVRGAWPRPDFEYRVDGRTVRGEIVDANEPGHKNQSFWSRYTAIVDEPEAPVLLECEINVPLTDYRRREGIVYYPPCQLPTYCWHLVAINYRTKLLAETRLNLTVNDGKVAVINCNGWLQGEFLREEAAFQRNGSSLANIYTAVTLLSFFLVVKT